MHAAWNDEREAVQLLLIAGVSHLGLINSNHCFRMIMGWYSSWLICVDLINH